MQAIVTIHSGEQMTL